MGTDALAPITFYFENLNGPWAQTNWAKNTITIDVGMGTASDNVAMSYDASLFGHELFHMLRQSGGEQTTPEGEKDAYDFQATLLANMGVELNPNWMVTEISRLDIVRDRNLIAGTLGLSNPSTIQKINNVTGIVGYTIIRVLTVSYSGLSGCYGSVCYAPGSMTHQFLP